MAGKTINVKDGRPIGYITTAEYARQFGVNIGTVRQWIRRGKVRAVKVGNQNFIDDRTPYPKRKSNGQPVEAWKPPIMVGMTIKYFYRVSIARTDIQDSPFFDVAGFNSKDIAIRYAKNIVKKNKDWDENRMKVVITAVALPPITDDNDTLATKIEILAKLHNEEDDAQ